ncbi:MAG: AMP-binding protein, partial [Acidimicrobiia bacterium]|nr:AMP-binding protein [Acidimicrobiia bacterium]
VRWVLPAGEVFPPKPLRQLMDLIPHARFSNVYGPAEVNQCSYFHLPGHRSDLIGDALPLGQASPGTELDLIDPDDNSIVGPGTGELIVRTSTMMAGYWNRPDLDSKGFLYRPGPGGLRQRWYRTGDVVRRDETGGLTFLGRSDNQVKIRGYRVELEVVEAVVGSLPGVEQAVVGPRSGADGDAVLVARYVPTAGMLDGNSAETHRPPLDEWRPSLLGALPRYAVPSVFEPVADFPLTPSGKIDRRSSREAIAATATIAPGG